MQQEKEEKERQEKLIEIEKERLKREAYENEMQRNMWLQTKEMDGKPSIPIKCIITEGPSETDMKNEILIHDMYQDLKMAASRDEINVVKVEDVPQILRNDDKNKNAINVIGMESLIPMTLMGMEDKLPKGVFDEEYSADLVRAFGLHELFGSYAYFEVLDEYNIWLNQKTIDHWRVVSYISNDLYNDILNCLDNLFQDYRLIMTERYTDPERYTAPVPEDGNNVSR